MPGTTRHTLWWLRTKRTVAGLVVRLRLGLLQFSLSVGMPDWLEHRPRVVLRAKRIFRGVKSEFIIRPICVLFEVQWTRPNPQGRRWHYVCPECHKVGSVQEFRKPLESDA